MAGVSTRNCPACQGGVLRRIGKLPETTIFAGRDAGGGVLPASSLFRCLACGLLFRHPVLASSAYDTLYGSVDPDIWPSEQGRPDWSLIEDYIALKAGTGANVLDFGCHTGGLLQRLGPRYALSGVEVNETAARVARQSSGAKVFPSLEALPEGMRFDFVTAVDVVEHFADPGQILDSLLRVTRHDGTLIITTGAADAPLGRLAGARWWYFFFSEHLAFISERWVREWLARSGKNGVLVDVRRFRYARLSVPAYLCQACLTFGYFLAPRAYLRLVKALKRMLGRSSIVYPPGAGLTKDHVFLAIRKVRLPERPSGS